MLTSKDVTIVYETLLSSPGMSDTVKIALNIPRKNVLLLSKVLETGLSVKDENGQGSLLASLDSTTVEEIKEVMKDLLSKAGLTSLYDKLNSLPAK
ncbi:hypothetical protein BH11BAC5_BH11BAC5_44020 [soil metagenome]